MVFRVALLRKLRINRLRLESGSFLPALQHQKQEILRSHCRWKQAYGCGIPLAGTSGIPLFVIPRSVKKSLAPSSCQFNQSFPKNFTADVAAAAMSLESCTIFFEDLEAWYSYIFLYQVQFREY